ncbi:MAG: hypothetical protein FXF49_03065 [Flexistipes sinusarabici]|uniref:Uncharacterized protein n=1 Tax=Flexistipes sinusarabici TaxID=2352 RepID=A0A5D0MQT0_FLESI|nr:hypothetical protein [Flexistipes sinusarabici]TYB34093.1 MAG: hypothetical protein FXF49_03065 [Flexistipes sinusarabici]
MLVLNPFIVISWILFTALFPIAFYWLRNAYKIFVKKDYSKVALKKEQPPKNPAKWAPFVGLLNLAAGIAIVWTIIGALPFWFIYPYEKWTGIAAVTIWFKLFGEYIIKTHAHPFKIVKNK